MLSPSRLFGLLVVCLVPVLHASAQEDSLVLGNAFLSRIFRFDKTKPGFYTSSYRNLITRGQYAKPGSDEFTIDANGVTITGRNCTYASSNWSNTGDERALTVTLATPVRGVRVILRYIIYDSLPLIRKRVQVVNEGTGPVTLANLDVERLQFNVVDTYMNEVYASYGTNLTRVPYKGDYNDAAVLLFNLNAKQGVILGNEAPSVLKRTEIYTRPDQINLGMGLINEPFPFKKELDPGQTFTSPQTFIYFSSSPKWQYAFEGRFQQFIREKLPVKLFQQADPPFFVYNTWQPFFDNINEKLIKDCVDSLKHTGCDLFIIDAGWYKRAGDFNPDPQKFPNGMKPVCDYIRSRGMRAGIWFTLAGVHAKSKVALEHPDWLVKDKNGLAANIHNNDQEDDGDTWQSALRTMSMGSGYYDHIHQVIRGYVKDWGISYLKLDLSIANSAYVHDYTRSGDYDSSGTKLYKDRAASYWTNYERVMQLFDTLKTEFPNLLIDCTFEVWGRYNVVDYALIEHADYDWLTNFDFRPPAGPISIRQMNYDRSRAVPASTLLIGNQFMNFPNYRYVYFSVAGGTALMVGDPRQLTGPDKAFYWKWNNWFRHMDKQYHFTRFRQTFDVFDRPTDENWDGCYRFNADADGGVLFFYRNNSGDSVRTFKVPCVNRDVRYRVYNADDNRTIGVFRGADLIERGLRVQIPSTYTAAVYGIEKAGTGNAKQRK